MSIKKKKYQLFWSVVHRNSHSPLSCSHLARPREKEGKRAGEGAVNEQEMDRNVKAEAEDEDCQSRGLTSSDSVHGQRPCVCVLHTHVCIHKNIPTKPTTKLSTFQRKSPPPTHPPTRPAAGHFPPIAVLMFPSGLSFQNRAQAFAPPSAADVQQALTLPSSRSSRAEEEPPVATVSHQQLRLRHSQLRRENMPLFRPFF